MTPPGSSPIRVPCPSIGGAHSAPEVGCAIDVRDTPGSAPALGVDRLAERVTTGVLARWRFAGNLGRERAHAALPTDRRRVVVAVVIEHRGDAFTSHRDSLSRLVRAIDQRRTALALAVVETESDFVLPRGCIDMGEMDAAQTRERTEAARSWIHALANSHGAAADERSADGIIRSFDVFVVDDLSLWLLHNRFVGVIGAVAEEPAPGRGWAVDQPFIDFTIPGHLRTWGPTIPSAEALNAPLTSERWGDVSARARTYADTYKPETVAQVLFNYWD